jgi:preprotein translocase subunit SecE
MYLHSGVATPGAPGAAPPPETIMAKPSTDEKDADRDEADEAAERDADSSEEEAADAGERAPSEEAAEAGEDDSEKEASSDEDEDEDKDEEQTAAQLGIQRYVLAAFFTAGILGAYVLGKIIHGIWGWAANKDWFHNALPSLAAVADEQRTNYGTVAGALIALVLVIRTYRKPDVRTWADEVANELSKVKWPTRKEVSSSTIVVIAASAVATIYLALLDRLWSFVTDLFYGTGS